MEKVKFGDTEFNYGYYNDMKSKIAGWERIYTEEQVRLLVNEQKRTTRSPAKATALAEWLEMHPEKGETHEFV